ncbi:MAG: hypothetical protein WD382_08465 [Halofilum sp. (in: g-proteobacteria)]
MTRPPRPMIRCAVACLVLGGTAPAAAESIGDGWSVGVDAMALTREYAIGDQELSASGALAGAYVSFQRFPGFRAEARLLAGGLENEIEGDRSSDPVSFGEGSLTWGVALPNRARLYGGIAAQTFRGELGEDGDETSTLLYLPLGLSKAGNLHGGWRAVTTLEARVLVGGRHEIEWPSGDSGDFDAFGGLGGELSARFIHPETPVEIEPYLRALAAADSRSDDFGGSDERVEGLSQAALGVRLAARF